MGNYFFVAALSGLLAGLWWPYLGAYFSRRYRVSVSMPILPWQSWEPVAGMVIGVLLAIWVPTSLPLWAAWWFALAALLAARIDLFCGVLPYRFSAGLALCGWAVQWWAETGVESLLASAATAGLMGLIAWVSRGGMGGGDVWFAAGMAAWLSPLTAWMFVCTAFIGGAVVGGAYWLQHGRQRGMTIPFGPCLAVAGIWVLWFGERMSGWSEQIIG